MKHLFLPVATIALLTFSCKKEEPKPPIVTPIPVTKFSEIIYQKPNGTRDSFHINSGTNGAGITGCSSDSFVVTAGNGNTTSTMNVHTTLTVNGTALNYNFKGTTTIRANYVSGEDEPVSYYSLQTDTSNKTFGVCTYTVYDEYVYARGNIIDTSKYYSTHKGKITQVIGIDTIECVLDYNGDLGKTDPLSVMSCWIIESVEKFGPAKFTDYASYYIAKYGYKVSKATYYTNGVMTASYSYNFEFDDKKRLVKKTITDNIGNVSSATYKYK